MTLKVQVAKWISNFIGSGVVRLNDRYFEPPPAACRIVRSNRLFGSKNWFRKTESELLRAYE